MHTFQPFPDDLFSFNPFVRIGQDGIVIASGNEEKANVMTASWGGIGVMWGKNAATIYVRKSRYTKEFIDNGDSFSITFLDPKYKTILKYFGSVSGRDEDKMSVASLNYNYKYSIPFVDEGNIVLLCKKMATVPIDFDYIHDKSFIDKWYSGNYTNDVHTMYIGEIIEILAR
ncbi:NADH-FMN oxidoreductase RutF, flavin reductase (DIM6/NTAB) family [Acetitomaculum ruminis DSM 5522]|uniref:NADH-FMN oxidoreductase RutF, flavin reductase (DIM6/NTAB) family n=1 Tax=Acetitomaculum ruminis DSM 5522 TaxID=1120918 RepID=A0A1I0YGD0_9FIRM|nr:flavin reductase [Acetitomaculum ruminis]SFB12475.1 NADH-FMN oxidoreductase RutF, flavin reductase (DIM6/NTAB) family [Acetitomaculum ruminis DSM 5522]